MDPASGGGSQEGQPASTASAPHRPALQTERSGQSAWLWQGGRHPVAPPTKEAHCSGERQESLEQARTHMAARGEPTDWQLEPEGHPE